MSDMDEKDSKKEETSRINQDGVPKNPETLSEDNVLSLVSNKNAENNSVVTENIPGSAIEGLSETLSEDNVLSSVSNKNAENNSVVTENIPGSAIEGSGDNEEVSELDLIEAELTEMSKELNMDQGKGSGDSTAKLKVGEHSNLLNILTEMDANASKADAAVINDEKNKCDEIEPKNAADLEDMDDEDIKLRWDDDDASNQPAGDDKNDDILSEEQLLEDSSDVVTKDANTKSVKDNSEENNLTTDDNSKEIATPNESGTEKPEDEKSLEDVLLEEPDVNPEDINSPEMIFSAEESMDRDFIKDLEDKLLDDSDMNSERDIIARAKEILEEECMDKEINEDSADDELEEIHVDKPDFKGENSAKKSGKDTENGPEKELPKDKELDDDVLLEEKLLEETDAAKVIPESDVTMEVDDEKEGELLRDDEVEGDGDTPMDVDVADPSTEVQAKEEDRMIDQPMAQQSAVEKDEIANPIDGQTDEIKEIDETDKAIQMTEKMIEQPVEGTTKTVDVIPVEEQSETVDINKDSAIDDQTKIGEENTDLDVLEKEHENLSITVDKNIKDQIAIETNTAEPSIKSSEQTVPLTFSNTPNTEIEETDKTTTDKNTLDKEIALKKQPEQPEISNRKEEEEQTVPLTFSNTPNTEIEETDKTTTDKNTLDKEIALKKQPEQPEISNRKEEEEQTVPLTFSNTPNTKIEETDKTTTDKNTLDKEIALKKQPEQPEITTESVHEETDLEKTEKSKEFPELDTSLDKTNMATVDSPRESVSPIKGTHGLNKPDMMLEIPSQELIDMDCTDLSLNLDDSIISNIKTEYDIAEQSVDTVKDDDHTVTEKPVETTKTDDTVTEKSVETTEADEDTASQSTVGQVAVVTDTKAAKDYIVNDKSIDQPTTVTEVTVDEVQTENKTVECEEKEETVVQATVEENMEMMFADDEPEVAKEVPECIASTSQSDPPVEQPPTSTQMTPDTSDEVPEVSDSLGLLAESAGRMMDDDDDDGDGDDDDDFDQDESSNQVSAEQSEDSNPAALESEPVTEAEDKELETPEPKEGEFPFLCNVTSMDKEKMDVEEFGTIELQAETIQEMNEEAKSAVNALLNADSTDNVQEEDPKETADQMDIVKLSDISDTELDFEPTEVEFSKEGEEKQNKSPSKSPAHVSPKQSPSKQSPSKMKNLAISTQVASSVVNIVDLEESSSSEDDVQETAIQKQPEPETNSKPTSDPDSAVTSVNIPTGIDIMCTSGGNTSEITTKEGEVTISGVPKPPPHRPARLNTSEVSIKTVSSAEPMVIPETKAQSSGLSKPKLNLEIFSLDSDDDDSSAKEKSTTMLEALLKSTTTPPHKMTALELEKARETSKCVNYSCTSDNTVPYRVAETAEVLYYDASRKRRAMICHPCADVVAGRTKNLIQGIKDMTPLLDLDMDKLSQDLVEISDSESEEDYMSSEETKETIGEAGAKIAEGSLAQFLNDTWKKYDMDARLKETQIMLDDEIEKLEQDSKEIDAMLNECQVATDKLRCDLYATFECRRHELPALLIQDTPDNKFIGPEEPTALPPPVESISTRQAKRRLSATNELPAKRPAIPLGYAPLDSGDAKEKAAIPAPAPDIQMDDDKDISVVKLSAESAPADLPPPGEISRPPLRVGMPVYAMKNAFGPWFKGRVLEIQPKNASTGNPYSFCRVRFDHKAKTNGKVLKASSVAYSEPADVRMTIGTRLIALIKDSNKRETYYAGVVAEIPNPVNSYRYLVFFDDGYAQYVQHQHTRLVCESSPLVWEEVHQFSRDFVREYLLAYPERPMVRLHTGQHLKTEWNGKWWSSRVTQVDASLAQVLFVGDGRREWIYRGSTRLAPLYLELRAAERHRPRPMPRSKVQPRFNMPYVEYTRSDEQETNKQTDAQAQTQQQIQQQQQQQLQNEEIRRQRAVAKKSTSSVPTVPAPPTSHPLTATPNADPVTSRVVYYTPKNAVKPLKMVPHKCTPKCKRSDVLSLKELRTYNPLAKPLLSGWERQIVRFKGHKDVMYRAPCGRRIRNMRELHYYLRSIDSDLPVDLFDFHYSTHCLAEFVLNKCLVGKKDLSHGKENVPVPCVNYYDDSLPEFCSYNTERTPTAGVPLNLEPEFLCGCDCTDDCQDKSKCACWKMTLEGARTIGLEGPNVGYVYKRLPEPLPSGIYECNSRCKCKNTCLNRVAQHPLQLKLQVFKTPNRGWGIRALNDVPKGSFLCVYAGNLLTDATANLDGLNEGDEYLAELDYIEVVEQMKEGYEEDIPEADKKLDKKESGKDGESSDSEDSSSDEEDTASKTDKEDDDFQPGYIGLGVAEFNKRLRKREKSKKDKEQNNGDDKDKEKDTKENKDSKDGDDDCITISDDEEVREPSRFMAQTSMRANEYISKYKSVRTLFGKDEACYIMDAKVQGNIGRYLNHSCCPNVFVQNVFVDTHDPRFPWVAFFALSHIKAGTELTWNYNYDVGSVPGKILYCYCGAVNCRGRLL